MMIKIVLFIAFGFLLGFYVKDRFSKINQLALNFWLLCLLFVMGISITLDPNVINNLKSLGFTAILVATFSVIGSIIALTLLSPLFRNVFVTSKFLDSETKNSNTFLILIFISLGLGSVVGLLVPVHISFYFERTIEYLLYLLLFSVGYDLYCNRNLLALVRKMGFKVLLIPLGVMLGSLIFTLPLFIFLPYNFGEVGALISGFGWYSLSSTIIGSTYCTTLGIVALLTNVFREVLAFILTPIVPKFFPPLAGIAPAGATSMDTLLPLISKSSGSEYTVPALVSGIVISSSVYILVPLFIEIAKIL